MTISQRRGWRKRARMADQFAQLQAGHGHGTSSRMASARTRCPPTTRLHGQHAHHRGRGVQEQRALAVGVGDDHAEAHDQHLRAQ